MVAEPGRQNVSLYLTSFGEFQSPEKVDLVWTTQNYHDLHIEEYHSGGVEHFNKKVHDSLKPGGVYIVLDHQAAPDTDDVGIA
jgi:predicted methyltransferase